MSLACEDLAERIRQCLGDPPGLREQRMFGGVAFMLHGNMMVGATREGALLVRVGKAGYAAALAEAGAEPMEMGGRHLPGFVVVGGDALEDPDLLDRWLARARALVLTLPPKADR
ncbi:RNA methyltransferase [Arsenicitalea aurantiaca]|uniref:RNA methyltransferase n=1 Tax=Arsenicitalea aurantiaca TaxID=1783274 RepID=A0A433XG88_9HYPH|nr:TfoX/Sxy family protein [Arsenicitalea aurantiaca]RUT33103.1 RNA methyltransferase [Arsenicitalea aurantiaca]